jgi:hypothetical protein
LWLSEHKSGSTTGKQEGISKMHLTPDGPAVGGIAGLLKCTAPPVPGQELAYLVAGAIIRPKWLKRREYQLLVMDRLQMDQWKSGYFSTA